LLIALAVVVVLGVAGIVVYQSPAFSVKTVQVNGANRLTNEYLEQAAAIPADSTLLRLDEKGILERLKDDPWIASAHLERQFPSTLLLVIEERTAAAAVEVYPSIMANEPGYWLISSEGRWLGVVDNDEAPIFIALDEVKDYPLITDIHRLIAPVFGETATDEGIENALAVLVGFSPEMRSLVASVSAPDRNKTALTLTNNVLVMFGAAEDITAKETAIKTLLNEHPDTLISINVRVANRPSFIPYGEE
jgi:cell division protein FtsQ